LLLRFPHFDFLLPTIILPDDEPSDAVLDTGIDNELGRMMEVVFNLEISFPARSLVGTFVVQPVDALEDTTVDQYRMTELTGGYRSQIVYAKVNTRNLVFTDFLFLAFSFVLYIHHKPKGLRCDDYLFVVSDAFDAEAVVARCNGHEFLGFLRLSSLDRFVVEDDLSQLVLVVRRLWTPHKLAWVFLPCVQCFLEVRPVGQTLAYGLLRRLRVMQVAEAILILDGSDEHVDVGQHRTTEPRTPHEEVALVVQFLAECAEPDDFGCSVNQMSFNQ